MKYAIFGVNRVAKDFLYMFPDLEIVCFFEESYNADCFMSKPVYGLDEIERYRGICDKIIVCDFDKNHKKKVLQDYGLVYEKDYFCEEDFFEQLDTFNFNEDDRPIVVWGTGKWAQKLMRRTSDIQIECFIDAYKDITEYEGKPVLRPGQIPDWKRYFVIIAALADIEIIEFLSGHNLKENADYISAVSVLSRPSALLRETIFQKHMYGFNCKTTLNHMEIDESGKIYHCCCTFFNESAGQFGQQETSSLWKSQTHKVMCLSTENHTYTFCRKDLCPLFIGKCMEESVVDETPYDTMEKAPEVVAIGYDSTCNLKCETCRDNIYIAKGFEKNRINEFTNRVIEEVLPECKFLVLAGGGEVFVAPSYKKIYLSDLTGRIKNIRLLSNGTLFNEKNWEEFYANKSGKIMATFSIDAATKSTYEAIRRGGKFDIIKHNMEFAAKLRREGKLSYFRMNFVVQRRNYQEIIPFVQWGLELGADEVFFTKIRNWGTYTDEEFLDVSMMEEDGMTPKKELQEILDNDIMKNPIVDLGTIHYAHLANTEDVKNYYMWELERKVSDLFD